MQAPAGSSAHTLSAVTRGFFAPHLPPQDPIPLLQFAQGGKELGNQSRTGKKSELRVLQQFRENLISLGSF